MKKINQKNVSKFSIFFLVLISLSIAATVQARSYDLYVDHSSTTGIEDGSETNPYLTITGAIEAAKLNHENNRSILVKNGEYSENVILTKKIKLSGENKSNTIIKGSDQATVKMYDDTKLSNIKVSGGNFGVNVEEKAEVEIEDCKITDTGKIGINVEEGKRKNNVLIKNCKIYDNSGKGIYVQKGRKIKIKKNKVYDNDEEGVDLRSHSKGTISKNKIYDNEESGIELVVGSSKLKIKDNTLKNNESSGVTNQFYKDSKKEGEITIIDNKITKNDNYGIKCATPSGDGGKKTKGYWQRSLTFIENIFSKNKKGDIQKVCTK